ncbi:MAG: alpha-amylase [Tissierellia bacterium]|nr:alpha-amylase [Tissierellia bacterium]
MNDIMLQGFEWYMNDCDNYWKWLSNEAKRLSSLGFNSIWIPPFCKATSVFDTGYGIYDLYDLGEFDQKGDIRTKYGTKEDLLDAIDTCHKENLLVFGDFVLNHKAGGDFTEECMAVKVDPNNREKELEEPKNILGWTGFNFPGRNKKYSPFIWHFQHFSGVNYDDKTKDTGIYKILKGDRDWNQGVSHEYGNYDYLMFSDIDHSDPDVKEEIFRWTDWVLEETGIDGIRFDALKHMDQSFIKELVEYIKEKKKDYYLFGEYWENNPDIFGEYLFHVNYEIDLFDVALHFHFVEAGKNQNYDLRNIFQHTLVKEHPLKAVTFVDNHDTQPGQALESTVADWFKPLAYGLILLRKDGYPCVFYGDLYGVDGDFPMNSHCLWIEKLMKLRKKYALGEEIDYFVDPKCIGWIRKKEDILAVVLSTGDSKGIEMDCGKEYAGKKFIDALDQCKEPIFANDQGKAVFYAPQRGMSAWIIASEN